MCRDAFMTAFSWVLGGGLAMIAVTILLIGLGRFIRWVEKK